MTQETLLKYLLRIAPSMVTRRRLWIAGLNLGWKRDQSVHFWVGVSGWMIYIYYQKPLHSIEIWE